MTIYARIIGVKDTDRQHNKKFRDYSALMTWMRRRGRFWHIEFETPKGRRTTGADIRAIKDVRGKGDL